MANEVLRRNNVDWGLDPFMNNLEDRFLGSMMPMKDIDLKTDIQETDKDYICEIDLPGVNKKDIHMNYVNGILNVNIIKKDIEDHEDKKGNMLLSERSYGTMSRSYRLPNVDSSKIVAAYDKGVLKITLPKMSVSESNGNIEIQ